MCSPEEWADTNKSVVCFFLCPDADCSRNNLWMCGVAWQVIAPMVRQLSLGELVQPSGTWLNDDTIGVFACPDGIRPVIFLLEAE